MGAHLAKRAWLVGKGEVGGRLAEALERDGWTLWSVTRTAGWDDARDPEDPAPRLVAVREDDLSAVLDRFGPRLRDRLVLVQNGFLEAVHGDLGPVTRGLIYFTSKGEFFRVLCASPFHGPLAGELAPAIARGGIPTEVVGGNDAFLGAMIVKGIWNAVIGLPLAVHEVDLATYSSENRPELEALVDESARAASAEYAVQVTGDTALKKILDTTAELGWVRGGTKSLAWRNGAISTFGRRHGVPTPVNDRLLRAVGHDPEA